MLLLIALIVLGIAGVAFFAAYWPYIVGLLAVTFLVVKLGNFFDEPVKREVRKQIPISFHVIDGGDQSFGRYKHQIAFTIQNRSPDYIVSDLHFNCEGGFTKSHPARLRPGQTLSDTLRVAYAEDLSSCVPVYELEKVW